MKRSSWTSVFTRRPRDGNTNAAQRFTRAMERIRILFGTVLVLGAIAYALGHYMESHGIRDSDDAKIAAQEKIESRELAAVPR